MLLSQTFHEEWIVRIRRKLSVPAVGGAVALLLLAGEPVATPSHSAHAAAAWEIVYADRAYWCEGCCTSNVWWACCSLNAECKVPIEPT